MVENKQTSIRLRLRTKEELDKFGSKSSSYDAILNDLLNQTMQRKKVYINYYTLLSKVVKRFFIMCEDCDEKRAIETHHKDSNRKNNILSNLKLLCRGCHTKIHYPYKDFSKLKHCR